LNGKNNEIKMEKPTFKMVKVNKTILQLIFTICFYPFTILVQKIPILPPIFVVNLWELRGTISQTVWTKLVGAQFPSLSWFYFMISLVKIEVFG